MGGMTPEPGKLGGLREGIALWLAPWLYVPHREDREEAFRGLAEVAYGSRDAIWTSPRVLVKTALEECRRQGRRMTEPQWGPQHATVSHAKHIVIPCQRCGLAEEQDYARQWGEMDENALWTCPACLDDFKGSADKVENSSPDFKALEAERDRLRAAIEHVLGDGFLGWQTRMILTEALGPAA